MKGTSYYLLALLFFTISSCEACRRLPEISKVCFDLDGTVDKDTLYLDEASKVKLVLNITPTSAVAKKARYQVVSWHVSSRMQGQLFLDKEKVTSESRIPAGKHELYYKPAATGKHTIVLQITDQYNDLKKEVVFKTIHVKAKKDIPFEAAIAMESKSIFVHKQAILSLFLSFSLKEASGLTYNVKAIAVEQGDLFFEEGHEEVKVGSKLKFGSQNLVFKPHGGVVQETLASIKLTLENDKGNETKLTTFIAVKPASFEIQAWMAESSEDDMKRINEECSIIEIMLTGVDEALHKEEWKLISWKCSDGVKRALLDGESAELDTFILKVPEKNRFYSKLPHLDIGNPPTLTLAVKGPDGSVKEAVVQFSFVQRLAIAGKIEALAKEISSQIQKADAYLSGSTTCTSCEELDTLAKETDKKLTECKEDLASIRKSPTLQEGMLPEKVKESLARHTGEELPALEKKKAKLSIALKEIEKIPFEAILEVQDKSIFVHQEAALSLTLSSKMQEAPEAVYTVKALEVKQGTLFFKESRGQLRVGSKLTWGLQTLVFKPLKGSTQGGINNPQPLLLSLLLPMTRGVRHSPCYY
jgi:hypothetical protein